MSIRLFFRLVGMVAFAIVAGAVGLIIFPKEEDLRFVILIALVGATIGATVSPLFTTVPFNYMRKVIRLMTVADFVAGSIGLVIGLIIAALLTFPLSRLPEWLGSLLPFIFAVIFGYMGVAVMVMRKREIFEFFGFNRAVNAVNAEGRGASARSILVDTSAIIDGRIADVSQTGFVEGTLIIPLFVMNELQHIADSADPQRRNRGRRGLEMLNKLRKDSVVPIEISDIDAVEVQEVDGKLVKLAKANHYPIITNDYNLNRVAELQGVKVLNLNELAQAVRPVVLQGEMLSTRITQEGKEAGQGLAYLDDGTMIVVENGRRYLNQDVNVVVTRVLQTVAGRMIFAQIRPGD